ncbi:MAG: F0F1 ATP synthase subunit gamma [Streptosporangiaceae bacterium]
MGAELRALRVRIRSIKSTAKITKAQELIAASKISRAQARRAASVPYARGITSAVSALISHHVGIDHALLNQKPDTARIAVLLITSDRGFCGGYNSNVLRHGEQLARLLRDQGTEAVFYVTGRRGVEYFQFRDKPMAGHWDGFSGHPTFAAAAEIGQTLVDAFEQLTAEGGVGEVHIVFTRYVSSLNQSMTVRRILPLEIEETAITAAGEPAASYEFEPSPAEVLDSLITQYVRGRVWNMLLESAASEHSARRQAMMSATDNAHDLIDRLTRKSNEARQAEVTTELNEIVSGANALTGSAAE